MAIFCPAESTVSWLSGSCGIDFTIAFEDYVLVLIPAGGLLLLAPLRLSSIWSRSIKVLSPTLLQLIKRLIGLLFVSCSFAALIASCVHIHSVARTAEIAGAAMTFVASVVASTLSHWEHLRSIRPSKLLQLYLLIALIVGSIRLRTLLDQHESGLIQALSITQIILCAAFLAVESISKERIFIHRQKRSPQDTTDLFSERLFWWLNRLFVKGYKTILKPVDLGQTDEDLSSPEIDRKFRLECLKHFHCHSRASLARIAFSALKYDVMFPIIPRLLLLATSFAQPYLILRLVNYLEHPTEARPEEAVLLVLATAVTYIAVSIFTGWYWQSVGRGLVKLRGCLTTALHDKALRCRPNSTASPLTLMNVDVERTLLGLKFLHEYWSTVLSIGISLWLLYAQLGIVFIAPLVLLIILIIASGLNGTSAMPRQKASFEATQERISYITSVVASMKNIKLLGISSSVLTRGNRLRDIEVNAQRAIRTALLLNLTISLSTYQLSSLVLYLAFAVRTRLGGEPLTTTRLFTSLSILKLFTSPLLGTIQYIPMTMQSFVSLQRIRDYLASEDHYDSRHFTQQAAIAEPCRLGSRPSQNHTASLTGVYAGYPSDPIVLTGISCEFFHATLSMVIGPVGSGKSTLLRTLLGETVVSEGAVSVIVKDTAFCGQTPWLWNTSIKENICGISKYEESWFSRVTWACGLHEDFAHFPRGIDTKVGSDGTALSGGQKNRISLARALYSRKRLVILDDVLSGLDLRTEKLVFSRVLGPDGLFKQLGCSVLFASHAIAWTKHADNIISLDNGFLVSQGPLAGDTASCFPVDLPAIRAEGAADEIAWEVDFGTADEDQITESSASVIRISDMRVYRKYISSFGCALAIIYVVGCALYAAGSVVQSLWLTWWAAAAPTSSEDLGKYAGVFTGITVGYVIIIAAWIAFSMLILTPRSSRYLHLEQWSALMNVIYAVWGSVDTGSVVNRFSQDISIIDEQLNIEFINFTALTFLCLASGGLVIVATPYIAATLPFLAIIFWAIQKVYLRTSKQLRAMDLEAKAPLCTHFLETISGIETIYAYGWLDFRRKTNARLVAESQVPFYLLESVQNWLALVLNLVVAGIATVVVAIAVKLSHDVNVSYIALALVQIMDLGRYCESLIVSWTGLETSLGAVARLTEFVDAMPPEGQGQVKPPVDWLSEGHVQIENLTASYSGTASPILKDIDLTIKPGTKVAICGRTGSGKSSLASALFGLLHITQGTIKIDEVDITSVSQDLLRSKMVAIPQDPYFTTGTVRDNLALARTSATECPDEAMIAALKEVCLYEKLEALALVSQEPRSTLLDMKLVPTDMLTKGQMQLFAMARAMLSHGQIVLVDEASSGLDDASEAILQELLRRDFATRTIIVIAHHLKTIMDFDTVVVMDHGQVVEIGQPSELEASAESLFGRLLRAAD